MRNRILTLLSLMVIFTSAAFAQKKVKERDVIGDWKLVIDLNEEEIKEEIDDEDSYLARAFASAVSGFVVDIVEDLDIEMRFHRDNKVEIIVEMWGENEVEEGEWYITRDGELVIEQKDSDDDDEVWLMEGEYLVQYDKRSSGYKRDSDNVYMRRID